MEVNYNGEWGTVCDDGWDDTNAGVVCRQLGFGSSGTAIGSAGFSQGAGPIWLSYVTCNGNESTLASCGHLGVGITGDCNHSKDIYIMCTGKFSKIHLYCNCSNMLFFIDFSVRVKDRTEEDSSKKGRVEILSNDKWGLVCANGWDMHDAIVVCQEKKLGNNGTAIRYTYNQTEIVWLSGVECVGNESQLSYCPHNGIGIVDDCTFIAGVECFGMTKNYKLAMRPAL